LEKRANTAQVLRPDSPQDFETVKSYDDSSPENVKREWENIKRKGKQRGLGEWTQWWVTKDEWTQSSWQEEAGWVPNGWESDSAGEKKWRDKRNVWVKKQ